MALQAYIGGESVPRWVEATSHHWLNKKYVGTIKLPVSVAGPDATGQMLKLVDPEMALGELDFHGRIKFMSAEDGENADGTVEYTAESAREIWEWRPARNGPGTSDPGNYIKPTFPAELLKGPLMMQDVLLQSNDGSDPALGEGPMGMTFGFFSAAGINLDGVPMNTPMTIAQLSGLLSSTGEVDIVETMIDSAGNSSQIDCYDGNYRAGGSGTFVFEPGGNVRSIKLTNDLSKSVNKLRYLLGPRISDTRWRRSIEASNMDIPDASGFTQASLVAAIMDSREQLLVRADVRIFDTFNNEADAVPLYWRLWQDESLWRLQPRRLLTITPIEGLRPTFGIGDPLDVGAWANFMGGLDGEQRVFGRKVHWNVDGVATIAEINASDNADYLGA